LSCGRRGGGEGRGRGRGGGVTHTTSRGMTTTHSGVSRGVEGVRCSLCHGIHRQRASPTPASIHGQPRGRPLGVGGELWLGYKATHHHHHHHHHACETRHPTPLPHAWSSAHPPAPLPGRPPVGPPPTGTCRAGEGPRTGPWAAGPGRTGVGTGWPGGSSAAAPRGGPPHGPAPVFRHSRPAARLPRCTTEGRRHLSTIAWERRGGGARVWVGWKVGTRAGPQRWHP
jgi:hypothetical protein